MSKHKVPFHIQQVAKPGRLERILSIAPDDGPFDAQSVRSHLTQDGYPITLDGARRSLDLGSKLGIFKREPRSSYLLTPRGRACQNLVLYRSEVYCDVIHFLLFATWELGGRQDYWSWSYAKICEILWRDRPSINSNRAIFGQLSAEAAQEFPDLDPVVGTETVTAVRGWLRELSPPFLVDEGGKPATTQEREWFSVELALLAVSYLYTARAAPVSTPILLDQPTFELLCPLCLASPGTITAMTETATRTFPFLDISTGEWGSSVVLRQIVETEMLA